MNIVSYIYIRYLFAEKKFRFISLINILSIIGIAIGVSALIIIMSIFNGFSEFTVKELIRNNPHITLHKSNDNVLDYLKSLDEIKDVYTSYESNVILEKNSSKVNAQLIYSDNFKDNVISSDLATNLKLYSNDTLNIISLNQIEAIFSSLSIPKVNKLIIDGIDYRNKSIIKTNDKNFIYSSSKKSLNIFLKNFNDVDFVEKKLKKKFNNLQIETWKSNNLLLLVIMEIEQYFVFFVLFLIVIIASFNLFASLSMTIFEKSKDIGILRTLGVNKFQLKKIFLSQGFISGIIGLMIGLVLGLLIVYTQITFQWISVNVSGGFEHPLPVELNYFNLIFIIIFTLFINFLSSYYPAKFSTNKTISEALKLNF